MTTASHAARPALAVALLASASGLGAQNLVSGDSAIAAREHWLASYDRLPEPALAEAFLRCDREARVRMLSFEDGVRCAMAWDALLRRVFVGDVDALIAWWRIRRDSSAVD
jgi:hypothetical protein